MFRRLVAVDPLELTRLRAHPFEHKAGRFPGAKPVTGIVEGHPGFGKGSDHHAVPGGDDLVVEKGVLALVPGLAQGSAQGVGAGGQFGLGPPSFPGVPAGVVAAEHHPFTSLRHRRELVDLEEKPLLLRPQEFANPRLGPGVVFPLDGIGLGVQGGVEGALRGGHFPVEEAEYVIRHEAPSLVPGKNEGAGVEAGELRLVVEHLLEMGNAPARVGGVAVEAAADLVVDAPVRHRPQRVVDDGCGVSAALRHPGMQQEFEVDRRRKLRGAAETSVSAVVAVENRVGRGEDEGGVRIPGRGRARGQVAPDRRGDLARGCVDPFPAVEPVVAEVAQQGRKAGAAVAVLRREVGAGVERLQLGRQEHGVGPPAVACHHLGGRHVDPVDVGALLTVDLDVDEPLVHQGGDLRVGEHLPLHHVAPVTGAVPDREKDRQVLAPRLRERLLPPGIPVDGVVGVQQQVGAGLPGEAVGIGWVRGVGGGDFRGVPTASRGQAEQGGCEAGCGENSCRTEQSQEAIPVLWMRQSMFDR